MIPQLPEGEVNTGLWKWNTGETTQFLSITANKSYAYRVTYTNQNGIQSEQLFTLAVQGDCLPAQGTQSIYKNGTHIGNKIVEINSGESLTLELSVNDYFGDILWSTGDSEFLVEIPNINTSRNITTIFTNHCGVKNIFIYQINLLKGVDNIN